ncbi:hypothetical protein BU17DRAFT_64135 [Hysterangium stoloniferum]|nr:hypothetical protein BU17DRAFT_64135 [Hysterangium stoloniferum]
MCEGAGKFIWIKGDLAAAIKCLYTFLGETRRTRKMRWFRVECIDMQQTRLSWWVKKASSSMTRHNPEQGEESLFIRLIKMVSHLTPQTNIDGLLWCSSSNSGGGISSGSSNTGHGSGNSSGSGNTGHGSSNSSSSGNTGHGSGNSSGSGILAMVAVTVAVVVILAVVAVTVEMLVVNKMQGDAGVAWTSQLKLKALNDGGEVRIEAPEHHLSTIGLGDAWDDEVGVEGMDTRDCVDISIYDIMMECFCLG